jgi:hypothetical protein
MQDFLQGFYNMYNGIHDAFAGLTFWWTVSNLCWALSAILGAWMIYDWGKTDGMYTEEQLTSSREGEIEAVQETHKV